MSQIAAWQIGDDQTPRRLSLDRQFIEKHLESWIQRDPSLLLDSIRWVSRQLTLPDGSRLDLLGLTNDGTWVIVELKAGSVETSTVLQALHYFLQIAPLTNGELLRRVRGQGIVDPSLEADLGDLLAEQDETREDYQLLVAGVGSGESAETAAQILSQYGFNVPIQVVTFDVVSDPGGRRILLREVAEEPTLQRATPGSGWSLEQIYDRAEQFGVRQGFEQIVNDLRSRGYRTRLKKRGVNLNLGSRTQVFWIRPLEGRINVGYLDGNFPSLFGIEPERARAELGENWRKLPPEEAHSCILSWADRIESLRREVEQDAVAADEGHEEAENTAMPEQGSAGV